VHLFCKDDVISKPFRIPDLMPKIEELVNRYGTPSATTGPSVEA
jgi:DNA-binding response OmpR family regulator